MACSCNGGSSVAVQPTIVASISPCACQGVASRVAPAQAAFNVSPLVTHGTVVIPRRCTVQMVEPVYQFRSNAVRAAAVQIKRGCGCRG